MPYRRNYKRGLRKNYRRRRGRSSMSQPWYRRKHSVMDMASAAWRGVKMLKGLVNVEKYLFDTTYSNTTSNVGVITNVSAIAQGDGEGARTGNSILAKYLSLKGAITKNGSATTSIVRILVVKDLFNTGTAPTIADILQSVSTFDPINQDTRDRYVILRDSKFIVATGTVTTRTFKYFIPINDHIKYTGSAATDEYKNQLYVITITNEDTNLPTLNWIARLAYHDN